MAFCYGSLNSLMEVSTECLVRSIHSDWLKYSTLPALYDYWYFQLSAHHQLLSGRFYGALCTCATQLSAKGLREKNPTKTFRIPVFRDPFSEILFCFIWPELQLPLPQISGITTFQLVSTNYHWQKAGGMWSSLFLLLFFMDHNPPRSKTGADIFCPVLEFLARGLKAVPVTSACLEKVTS